MNYYGAKELAEGFRTVRKNTIVIAEEIGEQHYGFQAAPDTRTVASILTHIAMVPRLTEQIQGVERRTTLDGFDFLAFVGKMKADEQKSRSKAQLIAFLKEEGDRFAQWLDSLSDDFLGERVSMRPGMTPASKTRFEMILGVKEHEMHHRAQLMLIERMVGIVPHLTREGQARMAAMQASQASANA
jgi:uncharacterized damage-inducible protein DinB